MNMSTQKKINLVLCSTLDVEIQMKVRDIRNEENIRKWMYTNHLIGVDEHVRWLSALKQDNKQLVFVVMNEDNNPLGVVSVNAIDALHKKSDWAYYLTESVRGGLGSALEFAFIEFVFSKLDIEKLNCEVIEGNDAVVKLHKKFLFQEEGFRRSNINMNGVRKGVHFLGLTREDWIAGKSKIQDKYKSVFEKYSISVQWNRTC